MRVILNHKISEFIVPYLLQEMGMVNIVTSENVRLNQFRNLLPLTSNWSSHHTTYWQHGDHLGSASWVTDTNGVGYQHLQYMPWGEQWVDQRKTGYSYNTRYTFSGKERDEETGFSYFGARYYQPSLSIWLNVDPMSDKCPNLSPYTYCGNNPVRLVDPDGREPNLIQEWPPRILKKWKGLSRKEKSFINWDIRFYRLKTIETNAEIAQTTAKEHYPNDKGKGDKCDAFRHSLWQALNVQKEGENLARDWAIAHEYETPSSEIRTDLYMDIHNNEVGIKIGMENPKASLEELSQIIENCISNGDMLILNKNGKLVKSDGSIVLPSEIRGYNTAKKIASDIINNCRNETHQIY